MITTKQGDVLKLAAGMIVHGCNCQGVMGSGIAKQVREQYPTAYAAYMEDHARDCLILGNTSWARIYNNMGMPKIIVNAYTQDFYGPPSKRHVSYDAVAEAFEHVGQLATTYNLKDAICFPAIGAGLGGGKWEIIANIIDAVLPDDKGFRKYLYVL